MKRISILLLAAFAVGCGQSKVEFKKEAANPQPAPTQSSSVPPSNETASADEAVPTEAVAALEKPEAAQAVSLVEPLRAARLDDSSSEEEVESTNLKSDARKKEPAIAKLEEATKKADEPKADEPNVDEPLSRPEIAKSDKISAMRLRSSSSELNQHTWQKWYGARNSELGGYLTDDNVNPRYETVFTLRDIAKSRCVFRNRLLYAPIVIKAGEELTCVPQTAPVASEVRMSLMSTGDGHFVARWVGTSSKAIIPAKGWSSADFRMTARIASRQRFDGAAAKALPDGMDVLLSTHLASMRVPDPSCALERTFDMRVTFNNGLPIQATLVARTEHQYVMDLEKAIDHSHSAALPVPRPERTRFLPLLKRNTMNACAYQHYAWAHCTRENATDAKSENCTDEVLSAVDTNFRALLDARVPGFGSDRVFLRTRDEANGQPGKIALWYHPDVMMRGRYNPLSIEDFQQMTDIVELKLSPTN